MGMAIEAMPLETLTELINEWGSTPRATDGRGEKPYPNPTDIVERLGASTPGDLPLTEQALVEAADHLHPVFSTTDPVERAQLINALLTDAKVRPTLRAVADHLHLGWVVEDSGDAILASAAIALRQYLSDHAPGRIGLCTGLRCTDVYIDASPAGRRRFCSVTCQNRARTAAYRSRRSRAVPTDR